MGTPGASASRWSQWVEASGTLDYVTKTLTIRATDRLGNRMAQALELPVVFDNVAPVLAGEPDLGPDAARQHGDGRERHRRDGGPDVTVSVRMQPPNADITRIAAARDGETWWFDLPADVAGQYTLWVDAEDSGGERLDGRPVHGERGLYGRSAGRHKPDRRACGRVGDLADPDHGDLQRRPRPAAGRDPRRPRRRRRPHRPGDDHRPVGSRRVAGAQPGLGAGRHTGLRHRARWWGKLPICPTAHCV